MVFMLQVLTPRFLGIFALVAAEILVLTSGTSRAQAAPADEGLIVALGDSLTAGLGLDERDAWPAQLERRLRTAGLHWKVLNAGISGETSSGARARLNWVLRLKPDILVLETGANDGLRGIPPQALQANLDAMLTTLGERRVTTVLAGMQMLRNMGPSYTTAFARVYPELAQKHRAILIPFFLEGVAANPALNQADGIHPTAEGYRMVTDLVYPRVLEAIARVRASRTREQATGKGSSAAGP
jgi:acyl-CoA thioesterase-1